MKSMGPGSIAGLVPGAALQHPPTIGANSPIRDVRAMAHGAYPVPPLSGGGCSGCMGTTENGSGRFLGLMLVPAVILGGLWYFTR